MLVDALVSELGKFRRNLGPLFWGFCAVPLAVLLFNLALDSYIRLHVHLSGALDLGQQVANGLNQAGSSFFQIFYAAGAAALFAGDYRWETWRLLTPRNSRINLILAKLLVFGLAAAVSVAALGLVAILHSLYAVAIGGAALGENTVALTSLAALFLGAVAEVMVLGAFTALVAVLTRSSMAALMAGIFFSFGQSIAMAFVHPWDAPLPYVLLLPDMAGYLLRAWVMGQQIAPGILVDSARAAAAASGLLLWLAGLAGATMALFQVQELARE